jgi:hypothetical protein
MIINQEYLKSRFNYNPETGEFVCIKSFHKRFIGKKVGSFDSKGYLRLNLHGKFYFIHRLAWLYMTGSWPEEMIDHIDHNQSNNKWNNLRQANRSQNMMNGIKHKDNKSGIKGVNWHSSVGMWRAKIQYNGKEIDLGHYDSKEAAARAYANAVVWYHNEYGRID